MQYPRMNNAIILKIDSLSTQYIVKSTNYTNKYH